MTTKAIKAGINEHLKRIDDQRFLRIVYAMLKEFISEEEEIIGYSANQKPITKNILIERAKKANIDIKKGKLYTQEEVRQIFSKKTNKK
jgi:hypothetical protein